MTFKECPRARITSKGAYLFIGFVFVAFLGMSNVGVAIVGAILAVLVFNSSNHANKEVAVDDNEI